MSDDIIISGIIIAIIAFSSAFINSIAGGGYGTLITPFLLLVGHEPVQFIPAILLSHALISTILIINMRRNHKKGLFCEFQDDCFYEKTSLKYIVSFGVIGLFASIFLVSYIDQLYIKIYIGSLTIFLGVVILILRKKTFKFSKKRIAGVSIVAAFNKGMSGGGYGSIISCGQILAGVNCKKALSTSYYAEAVISYMGFILYLIVFQNVLNTTITMFMVIGALLAIPLAIKSIEKVSSSKLTTIIGIILIILGFITISQIILTFII